MSGKLGIRRCLLKLVVDCDFVDSDFHQGRWREFCILVEVRNFLIWVVDRQLALTEFAKISTFSASEKVSDTLSLGVL